MTPRAFILDFDSTLVDFHAGDDAAIARVIGLSGCGAGFEAFQDHSVSVLHDVYDNGADYGGNIHRFRLRETLAHFGLAWDEAYLECYLDTYLRLVPVIPGARDFLEAQRAGGVRLGLLTNSLDAWEQGKRIDASGLRPLFDVVAIAAELGVWKPDPAAFHQVARALGCEPGECVFIGDSERHDIEGAKAAGMPAVKRLHRAEARAEAAATVADAVFFDYRELPAILEDVFGFDCVRRGGLACPR